MERLLDFERLEIKALGELVVSDVEADAAEFSVELNVLDSAGFGVPSARFGRVRVPVALRDIAGEERSGYAEGPVSAGRVQSYLAKITKHPDGFAGYEMVPPGEARETFLRRAASFLAVRLGATRGPKSGRPSAPTLNVSHWVGGPKVATLGCRFSVSTNSAGLRVHWSGYYRISGTYFGLATPAENILQAGTYVFGVDGGAYGTQIQWDEGAVVQLPGEPQVHLNY